MLDVVEDLVVELRRMGVPVSTSELIDAVRAVTVVDPLDREAVKAAVSVCVVKSVAHVDAFDTVFDLYLPPGGPAARLGPDELPADGAAPATPTPAPPAEGTGAGALHRVGDAELRKILLDSLAAGGHTIVREVARVAVTRHARIRRGRAVAGTFYVFRTLRALDTDALADDLVDRDPVPEGPAAPLAVRLVREHARRAVAGFERMVETEVRRRLVADRGADAVAETLRTPLPEDEDFLTASTEAIERMGTVLEPMGRALQRSLNAERRRGRRGPLDFRATIRGALSTGGVPVVPRYRPPRPPKPKLVVIADISGSVATFARFTLRLTAALQERFSSLRSFVFVDGMDEVTDLLTGEPTIRHATARMNEEARGVWFDGRSDYGHALELFQARYLAAVDSRTIVLVLGDGRANYHDPRADILAQMRSRAARLYWLNPERRVSWNEGDSVVDEYARHCDGLIECRTLRDLRGFVESLA